MSGRARAADKLQDEERLALEVKHALETFIGGKASREARAREIYDSLAGADPDALRWAAASALARIQAFDNEFFPTMMRLLDGTAPLADEGRKKLAAEARQARTKTMNVQARYAAAAAAIARDVFEREPDATWKRVHRELDLHPNLFPHGRPSDRQVENQIKMLGVSLPRKG